jgi:hypothetical protein
MGVQWPILTQSKLSSINSEEEKESHIKTNYLRVRHRLHAAVLKEPTKPPPFILPYFFLLLRRPQYQTSLFLTPTEVVVL